MDIVRKLFKSSKRLSVIELWKLGFYYLFTRVFYRKFFLVKLPAYIRVKGLINVGPDCILGYNTVIDVLNNDSVLNIGTGLRTYHRCHIGVAGKMRIGDNVLIGSNVLIIDHDHGFYGELNGCDPHTPPIERRLVVRDVVVGDNVWLGENVCVLPGAWVGNGVVVGANSVVTGILPDNTLCVGAPARPIKQFVNGGWLKVELKMD